METSAVERTREQLLDAAETLFGNHGFDGVSVRQIGDRAQANSALINYHFGGKAGLYEAVIQRRLLEGHHASEGVVSLLNTTKDLKLSREFLRSTLHEMLRQMMARMTARPPFFRLMTREMAAGFPVAKRVMGRWVPLEPFAKLIERAQKEGLIRKELSSWTVAFTLFSVHLQYILSAPILKQVVGINTFDPKTHNKIIEQNLSILLDGLWNEMES